MQIQPKSIPAQESTASQQQQGLRKRL